MASAACSSGGRHRASPLPTGRTSSPTGRSTRISRWCSKSHATACSPATYRPPPRGFGPSVPGRSSKVREEAVLSESLPRLRGNPGRVITFYSYKGGAGRTMALANVAWILASSGYRVLAVDWDLESPGLHRFFHPLLADPQLHTSDRVIDLILDF